MEPVDVQNRADAQLGAAIRRCVERQPLNRFGLMIRLRNGASGPYGYATTPSGDLDADLYQSFGIGTNGYRPLNEALDNLTTELERRSLLEPNRGES